MEKDQSLDTLLSEGVAPDELGSKSLTPEARRALSEAEERRKSSNPKALDVPENGGPKGLEPTRFGDWERKGRASDF